jgi:hypothetical protein
MSQRFTIIERVQNGSWRTVGSVAQAARNLWIWRTRRDVFGRWEQGRARTSGQAMRAMNAANRRNAP